MTTTPGITGATPFTGQPMSELGGTSQLDRDTFLKLLVAQLKYQDPSKPVDSAQFIAQSAQFTMVERLQELATSAQESAVAQRSATATGYLGRSIVAVDLNGRAVTGLVTSVDLGPDGVVLRVGDAQVPLAGVWQVSLPPPAAPADTAPVPAETAPAPTTPTTPTASVPSDPAPTPDPATTPAPIPTTTTDQEV